MKRERGAVWVDRGLGAPGSIEIIKTETDGEVNQGFGGVLPIHNQLWNEASWDRQRANTEITIFPLALRTGSPLSPPITNHNARGMIMGLHITSKVVGVNPLVRLNVYYRDVIAADAMLIAQSVDFNPTLDYHTFILYPGVGAAVKGSYFTHVQGIWSAPLPRRFFVQLFYVQDITSLTYSIGASLIV